LGIYEQVALSALYLLATVVPSLLSSHAGAIDRLAIYYGGTGLRISAQAHPLAQGGVHSLPGAVDSPSSETMMYGFPGRGVVGQESPGAAAANDVENGVEDLAQGMSTLGRPGALGIGI
jgi:hypothetical protein